ncbi:MAG TPA: RsmE family RNA methyltransferase [Acidimicrobiales bacterium]|nr:RsmE family RNA methyltransferase [Acidimicrobiales bacterium]
MTALRDRADAAAQVLVDDLDAPALDDHDAHHVRRVLRVRDDELVIATDGRGSWRRCALRGGALEPTGPVTTDPAPSTLVEVWLPALKGDRAEWAVAKLTELGVDVIGLLTCERASTRLDGPRTARVLDRWRRVAREAACQSRRTRLPDVTGPRDVAAAVEAGGVRCDLDGTLAVDGARCLLIGPEGGWSPDERAAPTASVSLADTVLRTETAAVTAAALLVAARRATRHDAVHEAQ